MEENEEEQDEESSSNEMDVSFGHKQTSFLNSDEKEMQLISSIIQNKDENEEEKNEVFNGSKIISEGDEDLSMETPFFRK